MSRPKSHTADLILEVAEQHFADRGYDAASLTDIARDVGIRTPSLYSHFKNKEALYGAVLDRRLEPLYVMLSEVGAMPDSQEDSLVLLRTVMRHYVEYPNTARLIQYAALGGGEPYEMMMDRAFRPLFNLVNEQLLSQGARERKLIVTAFISIVFGYINFAPVYSELLGENVLQQEASERHLALIESLI